MEDKDINDFNEIEGEETLSIEAKDFLKPDEEENPYPYENINIGRDNFSAFQLHKMYKNKNLVLIKDVFQWDILKKSELIESILIGFPLPVFYIKQNTEGKYLVLDGNERLNSIFEYMENTFSLNGLKILTKFNGYNFQQKNEINEEGKTLEAKYRGKIEDVSLTLYIIKEPTPEAFIQETLKRIKN
jgi:hypothetical protein